MPYWMWIGNNATQFNATPTTNLTAGEVASIVGYDAVGRGELEPVMMNGEIKGGNFQTTFNPTYRNGTLMSYTSPETDAPTTSRMTTAVSAQIRVTDLNSDGSERIIGTYTGLFVQMGNGDVFFRPRADHVAEWSTITRIYGIKVVSTTAIDANTAVNPTVGFNPDIAQIEIVPCFTRGAMIATLDGDIAIQDLKVGDLVLTRDNGPQAIRWIGSRRLSGSDLDAMPHLAPIRIKAGALGDGIPAADLLVSPQHRVLVRSAVVKRMLGTAEALVAAKQLVGLEGVEVAADPAGVEYHHMLFERHEIVIANGAETESLYTGGMALKALGQAVRDEIFTLFPELQAGDAVPARTIMPGRQARSFAARHLRNGKPVVAADAVAAA